MQRAFLLVLAISALAPLSLQAQYYAPPAPYYLRQVQYAPQAYPAAPMFSPPAPYPARPPMYAQAQALNYRPAPGYAAPMYYAAPPASYRLPTYYQSRPTAPVLRYAPAQPTSNQAQSEPPTTQQQLPPVPETVAEPEKEIIVEAPTVPLVPVDPSRKYMYAGASFYFMQPWFSNNTAYTTVTGVTTANPSQQTTDLAWSMHPAMSAWVGFYLTKGVGLRGQFFTFNHSSGELSAVLTPGQNAAIRPPTGLANLTGGVANFGSPGIILGAGLGQDNLTFSSSLRIEAIDVEITKNTCWGPLGFIFFGGARYQWIAQNYRATLTNQTAAASETQTLTFDHDFRGFGPTGGAEVNLPFDFLKGLSLYGSFRGSVLIGRATQFASFNQVVVDPTNTVGGSQTLNPSTSSTRQTLLPTTELELGVEYFPRTKGFTPVFRAGVVSQTYFGAGSASQVDGNFTLFGARLSVGVTY